MDFYHLNNAFYQKYGSCPEILTKPKRPYSVYTVIIKSLIFAIPMRHNITHNYAIKTIGNSGLDFSKSVVLQNNDFLSSYQVFINPKEYIILSQQKSLIQKKFKQYLKKYKKALNYPNDNRNKILLQNSSLQYFHTELKNAKII